MTNKKLKSQAFKSARACGFDYYWATKYARFVVQKGWKDWDFPAFLRDSYGFSLTIRWEVDPVDNESYYVQEASKDGCTIEYDQKYGCLFQTSSSRRS